MIGFTYRLQVDPDAGAPREYEHILVKNQQGDVEKVIWTVNTQSYGNGEISYSHSTNYVYGDSDWPDLLTSRNRLNSIL